MCAEGGGILEGLACGFQIAEQCKGFDERHSSRIGDYLSVQAIQQETDVLWIVKVHMMFLEVSIQLRRQPGHHGRRWVHRWLV
jgi:hypothetical protein